MDHQMPRSNDGFSGNNNLFGDSQPYSAYDNLFQTGNDQSPYDASWGVNTSNYPAVSHPQSQHPSAPSWAAQNANHLSSASANVNGQPSPYARTLSHSPVPYPQNAFSNYGAQQGFQYRQPQYDPSLVPPQGMNENFSPYSTTSYPTTNPGTIAPHALQHESRSPAYGQGPYGNPANPTLAARPNKSIQSDTVDQYKLVASIPAANNAGFFSIINFDDLARATSSERMGNFLNIGSKAQNWDINRAALPAYVPRKSRKDLRKTAGNDPKLLAKLGKVAKRQKASIIAPRTAYPTSAGGSPSIEKIKYEGDSSSAEESSSEDDDDSLYSSDDAAEPTPLPAKRPDSPKEATEYDTIKALWRGKRRAPTSEGIRKGLVDFWEVAKTVRDRWKADTTALTDAETKNRANEIPLLKSRVKDQRDMMETAFKAALKHGHRDIVELFSQNQALVFLCYQFLLDRHKEDDYNGPLSRAILETLSLSSSLKAETFEKTHLVKVLPRFAKNGDAKTRSYAKRITANVSAVAETDKAATGEAKKVVSKDGTAGSPTGKRAVPEPVAGIKRPASSAGDGTAAKKIATVASKLNGGMTASKLTSAAKKTTSSVDATKTAAAPPATAMKAKQVTAKPSGLFASLQSASKKPGAAATIKGATSGSTTSATRTASAAQATAPKSTFSFTETMLNLSKPKEEKPVVKPSQQTIKETPEEAAKRLRKESRRHLHVRFKKDDELTEVRVFSHDPDEELGHDASQMRDVDDVGGEGRMLKQQNNLMDVDEDDETTEEEEKLVDFQAPTEIDFVDVDEESRKMNFAPYGGGELKPESEERSKREHYEANNLMVFYAQPSDIPPNPREPSDPYNGEPVTSMRMISAPEEKWAARGKQQKAMHQQQYGGAHRPPMGAPAGHGFDLSKISNYLPPQQYSHPQAQQQQPNPLSSDQVSSILAALTASKATPPQPAMGSFARQYQTAPAPIMQQQPAAQAAPQLDLAAILAHIGNQQPAAQPPAMGGYGYNTAAAAPNMMGFGQQPAVYEDPSRKQWREGAGSNENQAKRQNPLEARNYKTKVCKYWLEGKCQKGDGCTFKHEN